MPGTGAYGEGDWVMDIGEGMCFDECCEVCKPGDSQTCTPGANNTLYVYLKNLKIIKKQRQIKILSVFSTHINKKH